MNLDIFSPVSPPTYLHLIISTAAPPSVPPLSLTSDILINPQRMENFKAIYVHKKGDLKLFNKQGKIM